MILAHAQTDVQTCSAAKKVVKYKVFCTIYPYNAKNPDLFQHSRVQIPRQSFDLRPFYSYNASMRSWKIRPGDPVSLTLAADSRLSTLDYGDDQIWEFIFGSGEPAALVLQTSFGLRARSMRIFPQFVESHETVTAPTEFETLPTITKFAPNYLRVEFSPFLGIDAVLEYWIPDSHTAAGRIWIANKSELDRNLQLELAALLSPSENGRQMVPRKKEATNILQGGTENLSPVLFITGGAEGLASPYPNLSHPLELGPDAYRRFTWVLAALPDDDDSFRHARLTAARNWDAEVTQIERRSSQLVHIQTGDPDWDAALASSQKAALNLLYSPNQHLPHQTFVSTRLPDQGYSPNGDGIEYNHLWSGQTPLESWYLSQFLLPGHADIAREVLQNFLDTQHENGFIDNKIGLAGQRSNLAAAPFLVSLAWRIYEFTEDDSFLEAVFRPLLWYLQTWFWESHDRDGDGVPEWSKLVQTGYDDNPAFSRWQEWAEGIDISLVESPDLCAYLYREVTLLLDIAAILNQREPVLPLEALADNLKSAVQNSWNGRRASFQYWDRDNHLTTRGEILKSRTGPGEILLDLVFDNPSRLQIQLEVETVPKSTIEVTIHGNLPNGQHRSETIPQENLNWTDGICRYTFPQLYAEVEHLHIAGLPAKGEATVKLVNHYQEDHTLLTPLWAGIPSEDQVATILKRKMNNENFFGKPFGIPAVPKPPHNEAKESGLLIWLPWNTMIIEGLLAYNRIQESAELFIRLMSGIIENLKKEAAFRAHYRADVTTSIGQRNHLIGLPSPGLFLEILGVRPISPTKVKLLRKNPFPWPVQVNYRGSKIESRQDAVEVQFLNGETITITEEFPCLVVNKSIQLEEEQ